MPEDIVSKIKDGSAFHGYLIIGGVDTESFTNRLKETGEVHTYNRSFGIAHSKEVRLKAQTGLSEGRKKLFVINGDVMTPEAQSAMLKLLEEPLSRRHFFITAKSRDAILGTLRSRLSEVYVQDNAEKNKKAEDFLNAPFAQRIKMIPLLSENKNNISDALDIAENRIKESRGGLDEKLRAVEKIENIRRFLAYRGTSAKMCLEYLSLLIEKHQ